MVATFYIKLFRTGADRCNGILMSLLLLVAKILNQTQRALQQKFLFSEFFTREIACVQISA